MTPQRTVAPLIGESVPLARLGEPEPAPALLAMTEEATRACLCSAPTSSRSAAAVDAARLLCRREIVADAVVGTRPAAVDPRGSAALCCFHRSR